MSYDNSNHLTITEINPNNLTIDIDYVCRTRIKQNQAKN